MKFEIQALILLACGLCALVTCAYATKLADLVDSKWLDEDGYSDQRYLIAELIEAQEGGKKAAASGKFIKDLHDSLQKINKAVRRNYDKVDNADSSHLGPYEDKFKELMAHLDAKVAARFEGLRPKMSNYWFDGLRKILLSMKSIVRSHGCDDETWKQWAQTVNSIYGREDLNAFLAGESKLYPKFQAFLLHFGKRALRDCVESGDVFGDKREPEAELDEILEDYGDVNNESLESELLVHARELDFVTGKFDSKKMLTLARYLVSSENSKDEEEITFDQFYDRLHAMCALYNQDTTVNNTLIGKLARLLLPELDLESGFKWSARALKMKEYERIYSSFCSASKEDVAANFKRNKPQSKGRKFLSSLG